MKKFLLILLFLIFSAVGVQAKSIKVVALESFSSQNPSKTFAVEMLQDEYLPNDTFLPEDAMVVGQIIHVEAPKRGKRNGYIKFVPQKIIYESKTIDIKDSDFVAIITYYRPIDPEEFVMMVARKTVNFMFHGIVSAAEFIQGAIDNNEGNRIKSGVMNVYKDSFLVYIEVGDELNVHKGDTLVFKIKRPRKNSNFPKSFRTILSKKIR